jgi:hypothetical protein
MALKVSIETTVEAFTPAQWDNCFPGELEGWAFYRACEAVGPPGFSWYYIAALDEDRLIAAVPAFGTDYRLDTTVQGVAKRISERIHAIAPRLTSLRLMALGSPVAEICHLGFAGHVPPDRKVAILGHLVEAFQRFARKTGFQLFAVKDAPDAQAPLWQAVLVPAGFSRLPGLPTAVLNLGDGSFDAYLASLSRATRKDMRRKLRQFETVRVEQRWQIDDVVDDVFRLYGETLDNSELQFERLPREYFQVFLKEMSPRGSAFLFWADEGLIAFNLVLEESGRLVDKYVGMDYRFIRRYSPYFNTWLHNVRYCVDKGIPVYQSGQAGYAPKLRLGCTLQANWQYFQHCNPLLNALMRVGSRLARLDRFDPAINALLQSVEQEA